MAVLDSGRAFYGATFPRDSAAAPSGLKTIARISKKASLRFKFEAKLIEWRGPAPFVFAPMPPKQADELHQIANSVSYGWGCIPVEATVGGVVYTSSLFPRDGTYLLPIKVVVRRKTNITVGDTVKIDMTVQGQSARMKRLAAG